MKVIEAKSTRASGSPELSTWENMPLYMSKQNNIQYFYIYIITDQQDIPQGYKQG